jgi:hypothetical protein
MPSEQESSARKVESVAQRFTDDRKYNGPHRQILVPVSRDTKITIHNMRFLIIKCAALPIMLRCDSYVFDRMRGPADAQ